MADVRYALRMLRRSPGFTAVAVLSLALGIGANTAIFSLINTLMLRPLPVRQPGELVQFVSQYPDPTEPPSNNYAWKYYERFRDETYAFSDLTGVSPARFRLRADGLDADAVDGEYVAGNFFTMLGETPAAGRLINPQDDVLGSSRAAVAVLSWASWTNRFHADPAVVGKQVALDGVAVTVIGVAPRPFFGIQVGAAPELWLPVSAEPLIQKTSRRASRELSMSVIARLKPGVSLGQARAELQAIGRDRNEEIARRGDRRWRQTTIDAVPAPAGLSRLDFLFARPLFALLAIVGLLLLLACTSVATLLLARGAQRQREMTVRIALGAGRLRLVRQVLTESLLLAGAGCLLGIGLAYFGADALMRVVASGRMPGMPLHLAPQIDRRVLLFTVVVSVATGVLFGLAPALSAGFTSAAASMRATGAATDTPSRRVIGQGLVVAQVALSIVLLSAAGLFVRHVVTLRNVGLGFQRDSVLLVSLDPAGSGYERSQLAPIYTRLLERLQAIPGVRAAAVSAVTPVSGAGASRFIEVPGFQERAEDRRRVVLNWVSPNYFQTLGTPVLAGRDFAFEDQGRAPVAIVSQSMARYYFGSRSPIGQLFSFERQDNRGAVRDQPYEIVGVVGDTKYLNLQEPIGRMVYLHAFQDAGAPQQFSLRTSVRPEAVASEVRRVIHDVVPTVTVARTTTMTAQVDASMIPERLIAMLSGFFGALGALLAAIGLYGLLAYTVARRTSEIGIRIALGATQRDVLTMVHKSALGLAGAGVAFGVPLAFAAERVAVTFVDNISAGPLVPVAIAAAAAVVVALVAASVPAHRASRISPVEALRQD